MPRTKKQIAEELANSLHQSHDTLLRTTKNINNSSILYGSIQKALAALTTAKFHAISIANGTGSDVAIMYDEDLS